jgi:hypothetical protein
MAFLTQPPVPFRMSLISMAFVTDGICGIHSPRNQLALVPNISSYFLRRHLDAERDLGSDRAVATMCKPDPRIELAGWGRC